MRVRGLHHLAIQVLDVERTARWYREGLGLPEQARFTRPDGTLRSIWWRLRTGFLALEHTEEAPTASPFRRKRPGPHRLALRIDRSSREPLLRELESRNIALEHQT